jgi:uncharacterized Zn ribbon protein
MTADGVTTSEITVLLKDVNDNNLDSGGDTVTLATDLGSVGSVTDNGNGTYTATLTSGTVAGTATITGSVNAAAITDTATVTLTPDAADATTSLITASPTSIAADGAETSTITVQLKDVNNNDLISGGDTVTLATDLGSLGSVTDNSDGTYTATLTSGTGKLGLGYRQQRRDLHGYANLWDNGWDGDDHRFGERCGDHGYGDGNFDSCRGGCHDVTDHGFTDFYGCRRRDDLDGHCAAQGRQ